MSRDSGVGRGICIAAIVELEPETLEKGQCRSAIATHAGAHGTKAANGRSAASAATRAACIAGRS